MQKTAVSVAAAAVACDEDDDAGATDVAND